MIGLLEAPDAARLRPVKAPFRDRTAPTPQVAGMAAMFKAMNGPLARGLCLCRACATSPFPVPDSPLIRTVMLDLASRPIAQKHLPASPVPRR